MSQERPFNSRSPKKLPLIATNKKPPKWCFGASLSFGGELIVKISSSDNNASGSSYSGQTGRWQVLALYKTEGGKLICERIDRTRRQGERDSHSAKVCANNDEVIDFFGHGRLAKDLYDEAGIDSSERVD